MKIVRQTPERMVLLHRPLLLCGVLAAGALLLMGVGLWNLATDEWFKGAVALLATAALTVPALWFAAESVDVVLDADAGTCTIDTRRLSGPLHETINLSGIERAMVQTHKGPGDTSGAHRVALVLSPGRLEDRRALTPGYAGGRGAADVVARINAWLEEHRQA
jgi:hypothetical protein